MVNIVAQYSAMFTAHLVEVVQQQLLQLLRLLPAELVRRLGPALRLRQLPGVGGGGGRGPAPPPPPAAGSGAAATGWSPDPAPGQYLVIRAGKDISQYFHHIRKCYIIFMITSS